MNMLQKRLKDAQRWEGSLTPYVEGRLMKYDTVCKKYTCYYTGNKEYEVNKVDMN